MLQELIFVSHKHENNVEWDGVVWGGELFVFIICVGLCNANRVVI